MFDPEITTDIRSFLMELSSVPLGNLIGSIRPGYRYGYIGMRDRMMFPLTTPGAIVQIDENAHKLCAFPFITNREGPSTF